MSNRLVHIALLAVAVSATGSTLAALSHGLPARHAATDAAAALQVILLPTVVVHPEPSIPTLGTITVLPDRSDRVSSSAGHADDYSLGEAIRDAGTSAVGSLPSASLDMPYYSFGRTLRRAAKE